jgi:hypothetical protein
MGLTVKLFNKPQTILLLQSPNQYHKYLLIR